MEIFRSLSALNPTSQKFLHAEVIRPLSDHYGLNMDDLTTEMKQARRMITRNNKTFDSLEELAEFIFPLKIAFTELCKVIQITLTLPTTTATCERSFSKLKLIKSHLRTTMADRRLKAIAVLSVHKHRAMDIDLDFVVDKMVTKFPNMRLKLV